MRVGPLDLPVSNVNQIAGFFVLVLFAVFILSKLPIPAQYRPATVK